MPTPQQMALARGLDPQAVAQMQALRGQGQMPGGPAGGGRVNDWEAAMLANRQGMQPRPMPPGAQSAMPPMAGVPAPGIGTRGEMAAPMPFRGPPPSPGLPGMADMTQPSVGPQPGQVPPGIMPRGGGGGIPGGNAFGSPIPNLVGGADPGMGAGPTFRGPPPGFGPMMPGPPGAGPGPSGLPPGMPVDPMPPGTPIQGPSNKMPGGPQVGGMDPQQWLRMYRDPRGARQMLPDPNNLPPI